MHLFCVFREPLAILPHFPFDLTRKAILRSLHGLHLGVSPDWKVVLSYRFEYEGSVVICDGTPLNL